MKKLLVLLPITAALITACGGGDTGAITPGQSTSFTKPASVNGTIQGYTRGAATIDLLRNAYAAKSASNPALASTILNANGTFTLPLPSLATITPLLSASGSASDALYTEVGCSGSLSNSVPEAQAYSFSTLNAAGVIYDNGSSSVDTQAGTITEDGSLWVYTTKSTTLGGTLSCKDTSGTTTNTATLSANAPLTAGWNLINLHGLGTLSSDQKSFTLNLTFNTANDHATVWTASTVTPMGISPLAAAMDTQIKRFKFGALHF